MTERLHVPKSEALRQLFWRSEILQVMYWLRGESLGEEATPELLERFLGVDAPVAVAHMDRLVDEGYLTRSEHGYRLSERGADEGAEEFEAAFAKLTRPTHGECSPDCWCHASAEEAEVCASERAPDAGPDR